MRLADLDPERVGEYGQASLALQRKHRPGERRGADHRRVGPFQPDARERLIQHPSVKRRVVGDHHAATQLALELRQHRVGFRGAVDHRLRDPGEALDPAPQRRDRPHQRVPAVVELAAADEHGADLGDLAGVAAEPVRLGVDDEELSRRERFVEQVQEPRDTPASGRYARGFACEPAQRTSRAGSCACAIRRLTSVSAAEQG